LKKAGIILIFIFAALACRAQNNSIFLPFNQYMFNTMLYNPAYTGTKESFSMEAIYRKQWISMKGTPAMAALTAHSPLKNRPIALGIQVDNLSAGKGAERSNNIFAYYSHRFDILRGSLRLGLRAGVNIISKNLSGVDRKYYEDPAFSDESFVMPNFGIGAYYYTNVFYLGLSVPYLLSINNTIRGITHDFKRYNITGTGGVLLTFNDDFKLKPSGYVQYTVDQPLLYITSLSFILMEDMFWVSGSYKSTGEIVGIIEFQITKQVRFGYSYDFPVGDMKGFMSGSHEFLLRYDFSYVVRAQNPGYFW
jgi:type IX secretion system PorP/SprF family membrane protein